MSGVADKVARSIEFLFDSKGFEKELLLFIVIRRKRKFRLIKR